MTWPITWPAAANIDDADPNIKLLAEVYARACMIALTLQRVGQAAVTIMPAGNQRIFGRWVYWYPYEGSLLGYFYPGTVYPSAEALREGVTVTDVEAIPLPGPVGAVSEVKVGGVVLDPANYRVENGQYLVRTDGESWPSQAEDFTVTYFNSYPVDEMGSHAAGVMAWEWLKLLSGNKGCRLPPAVTNVSRQGLTYEVARGMFPDGKTGLPEIDAYLMLFNPFGLKVAPRVYSPDLPAHRQVW